MSDIDYLVQLAKRCRRLARSCFDLGVAGELREMASELEHRASEPRPRRQPLEPGAPAQRPRRPD